MVLILYTYLMMLGGDVRVPYFNYMISTAPGGPKIYYRHFFMRFSGLESESYRTGTIL
jgi:hypothetical protein